MKRRTLAAGLVLCAKAITAFSATTLVPIYPAPDASNVDIGRAFTIPAVAEAGYCDVYISEGKSFSAPLAVRRLSRGTVEINLHDVLVSKKTYWWQVVCRESSDSEPIVSKSQILSFTTGSQSGIPPLVLVAPAADEADQPVWQATLFTWQRFDAASKFKLVVKADGDKDAKSTTIDFPSQVSPPENQLPWGRVELKPGKNYNWHVDALDKDDKVIARSDDRRLQTRQAVFEALEDYGVSVHRAFTLVQGARADDPATLGLSAASGSRPVYATEFAVQWADRWKEIGPNARFTPIASVEARLHSTGDAKGSDALKARLSAQFDVHELCSVETIDRKACISNETIVSLKYETDRKADTKKLMAEFLYTPIVTGIFGEELPVSKNYTGVSSADELPVTYMVRPYLGFDAGRTSKIGDSLENETTVTRATARLNVQFRFRKLAEVLNLANVTAFIDDNFRYLFHTTSEKSNNYLTVGADFFFNEAISLALRGAVGRDAPTFNFGRTGSINFGIKF